MMSRSHLLQLTLGLFFQLACVGALGPDSMRITALEGNRRVLFVGNSHTYENDLPGMLQSLARLSGDTALRAAFVAYPNYALEDHMASGNSRRALRDATWEFVVLQQGTSAQPESQAHLEFWTAQFAPLVRAAGAEPVLYQIWPLATRRFDAAAALTSYHNAAVAVGGILAPAGDAFTAALDADAVAGVYALDGLHASYRGTYLAALVLLGRISAVDPAALPPVIPGFSEDSSAVRALQRAAGLALGRNPARPTARR